MLVSEGCWGFISKEFEVMWMGGSLKGTFLEAYLAFWDVNPPLSLCGMLLNLL